MKFHDILAFFDIIFPRHCTICGRVLTKYEHEVCARCLMELPRCSFESWTNNTVTALLANEVSVVKGGSMLRYEYEATKRLILSNKYGGWWRVGLQLGKWCAEEYADLHFFDDMDLIIPVPTSRIRKWKRGYNQVENICSGLSQNTGIPVSTRHLVRPKNTKSQVGMNAAERKENVADAFAVRHADELRGKHVLVVDDVTTTGSTLCACAKALAAACPDLRISVLTMALVHFDEHTTLEDVPLDYLDD